MINNVDDLENLDPNDIIISMDDNIELELKYHKDLQWLDYERSGHTGFMPSDPSNLNDFDSEATNEQIELFGNDSANPGKISLATLKLKMNDGNEKSFASSINISQNPQTGVVTFQLYSKDNTLLDTKTLDLDTEHIIKSISLNYAQKKLIFTMADNTTLECDISDLIDTLQNNINNVSNAKADKVVNGVENNIVLLDSNGNIKDSGKSINDVGKVASVSIGGATPIQPDQNKNIDLPAYPTKNSLGLNNVDNTSDINKPISTAQQTALDLKEDKSNKVASWSDTPNNTNYPSEKLVKDALDLMNQALNLINGKIPSQASAQNQLADKDYVNSSIATNTATFKGTYNSINDLPLTNVDNNDYAFVMSVDVLGNTSYSRYKYVDGTGWAFEYTLNNSSFTAEQWATINSGMTLALKNQITTNQQDIANIKNGTNIDSFADVEEAINYTYKGEAQDSSTYNKNDLVSYRGTMYLCLEQGTFSLDKVGTKFKIAFKIDLSNYFISDEIKLKAGANQLVIDNEGDGYVALVDLPDYETLEYDSSQTYYLNNAGNYDVAFMVNSSNFETIKSVLYIEITTIYEFKQDGLYLNGEKYGTPPLIETTYANLKSLRDNSQLVKGMQYRITDYQCTTITSGTSSAGHQFDIIVVADDVNVLNENARACLHSGDTYFANSKLEAWELKYCLDNDTTRFDWADSTNGKGVIYFMKDESNNECPYDFKNILYTFDFGTIYTFSYKDTNYYDASLRGTYVANRECYNNVIKKLLGYYYQLPKNVFYSDTTTTHFYNNFLDDGCYQNTFKQGCYNNKLGKKCHNINFGNDSYNNFLGDGCYNIGNYGSNVKNNTFGNNCYDIAIDNDSNNNKFGNNCYKIFIATNFKYNEVGNDCHNIRFGVSSSSTQGTTQSYIRYVKIENNCCYIDIFSNTAPSSSSYIQNILINTDVKGSSFSNRKSIQVTTKLNYLTEYKLNDSTEVLI